MAGKEIVKSAITFDDVLLIPQYSDVMSRKDVNVKTRLTRNLTINNPIVSSNMDTVTETQMAIAMARNGGIGILHRFLSVEEQVAMVKAVKRAESFQITDPWTARPDATFEDLENLMQDKGVHSILITDAQNKLQGIVTSRDLRFVTPKSPVSSFMTPRDKLITAPPTCTSRRGEGEPSIASRSFLSWMPTTTLRADDPTHPGSNNRDRQDLAATSSAQGNNTTSANCLL